MKQRILVLLGLYLAAIIGANLTTGWALNRFGLSAAVPVSLVNSFLFIGLDLTTRDALHEAWQRRGLVWKMGALIAAGSVLSYVVNHSVAKVALASFAAFAAAGLVDAVVFHRLRRHPWFVKANGSNVTSAAVDSLVFPTIAFGALIPWVVGAQFAAKVVGGFVWSLALGRFRAAAGDVGRAEFEAA